MVHPWPPLCVCVSSDVCAWTIPWFAIGVGSFGRVVLTPVVQIGFRDFFVADQMNSLVIVFYDIEYSICYFVSDLWLGTRLFVRARILLVSRGHHIVGYIPPRPAFRCLPYHVF